ncbi:hypothetical protein MHK74_08595 [Microbacterium aurum]|uniref:competence protein CoiA family protein n=1 Tax=Microbacterium aurum TaxID=36805 RepID=UPI001EF6C1B8|nr:competence protein CoiA family protein [Microbacterium aurum]MCG7414622.1 hypothetical protein [Microbacterium aurum]
MLADGSARNLRSWAKRELRCMFRDCPSPDLTTVARANRRDGFSHFKGGGNHAPESVNHRQGKAVVANWLRELYGAEAVAVEEATDTQRSNVADVLLTHPSGRRAAFEVQYAPLSVQAWRDRHESYVRQGIIDVWLWGHTRVHKSRSSYATGPYRLDDTQDELRKAGARVTFLNPETAQIGVATGVWDERPCLTYEREFELSVGRLSMTRMSDDGLTSELIAELARVSRARQAELARSEESEERRWQELVRAAAEAERMRAERLRVEEEQRAARESRRARITDVRRKRQKLVERDPRRGLPALTLAPSTTTPTQVVVTEDRSSSAQAPLLCRACGLPLDSILAASGYHVGPCEWGWRQRAT